MTRIQQSGPSTTKSLAVLAPIQHERADASRTVQNRLAGPALFAASSPEEVLVVEERAHLRPAQVVESKLTRMLQEASFPASHLQMRGLLKTR